MAGVCPPAILVLRQFTHLRALLRPALVLAMAIAQWRLWTGNQRWGLIGQGRRGGRSQKNCDSNGLTDSVVW